MVGWTTTGSQEEAQQLARGLVGAGLAACVQVSGPITSVYRWEGKIETGEEFRVAVKFRADRSADVEAWIAGNHGYDTPQWVAVRVEAAAEKYLKWVLEDPY